ECDLCEEYFCLRCSKTSGKRDNDKWRCAECAKPHDCKWIIRDAHLTQVSPPSKILPNGFNRSKFGMTFMNSRLLCMKQHILPHPNASLLLDHLQDVWFLEGRLNSEKLCRNGEPRWKDILSADQLTLMQREKRLILCMALITIHESFIEL